MKISKQELKDKMSKKRYVYSSHLIEDLWKDFEELGWGIFDESILKQKIIDLETNINSDIRGSPLKYVKNFKKEILGTD